MLTSLHCDNLGAKLKFRVFFNCSSPISGPKWKTGCSQPELLFREIFTVTFWRTLLGSDPSDPKMSLMRVPNYLLDLYMIYLRCVDSVTAKNIDY